MGRPLNKRLFAVPNVGPGAATGNEIKVNFHNGTAVKEGYIVKQVGSKKFVCEEIGTAGEFTCTLTTGKLPANLAEGEMSILVNAADNERYTVSKISSRRVTLSAPSATGNNIYDNTTKYWLLGAGPLNEPYVRLEEAGDDNVLIGVDDDSFGEDY
jgi:hypothetical protein